MAGKVYPTRVRRVKGSGACANPSFTPAPAPYPLPTLEQSRRTPCRISYATRTTGGTPTMELTYQEVYPTNPVQARKRIIHIYQQTQNHCETARRCHTAPQLVRKWVKRDQQYGEQGLHDLSILRTGRGRAKNRLRSSKPMSKPSTPRARSAPNAGITCASIASPAISGLSLKVARGCACWRSAVRVPRCTGWRF
jgi:transposase-like protein